MPCPFFFTFQLSTSTWDQCNGEIIWPFLLCAVMAWTVWCTYLCLIHDPILKARGMKESAKGWIVTMRTAGGICCSGEGCQLRSNITGGWVWACDQMILKSKNLLGLLKLTPGGWGCVTKLINGLTPLNKLTVGEDLHSENTSFYPHQKDQSNELRWASGDIHHAY